jgi:hypothetical protein
MDPSEPQESVKAIKGKKKMEVPKEGDKPTEMAPNAHNLGKVVVGEDSLQRLLDIFDREEDIKNSLAETDEPEK